MGLVLLIVSILAFFSLVLFIDMADKYADLRVRYAKLEIEVLMLRERYEQPKITSESQTALKSVESS